MEFLLHYLFSCLAQSVGNAKWYRSMSSVYSSNNASIAGINSEFHFSEEGYSAFTDNIAPHSLRFTASGISNPVGIAEKLL